MPVNGDAERWQVSVAEWRNGLRRTYARFAASGIRTIVLRDVPRTPFDAPACLSRRDAGLPLAGDCLYDRAAALSPVAIAAQDAALRGLPVSLVDMNDQVCATTRCPVERGGVIIFTDDNHLTASFSRTLGPELGRRVAGEMRGKTSNE